MAKREFSDGLRTFVNKYITSVEQIEVLLLLLANPQRVWSVHEISAILRSSPASIQTRLAALAKAHLAVGTAEVGYRYAATGRLHALVEELSDEYGARRFSVIELVFSRQDPARSFADAFRLREDEQP
jgi:hypothetical protein